MRLNHLDLHSPVVTETASFFIDHLGFMLVETRGKDAFCRLADEAGMVLVISPPIARLGGGDQVSLGLQTYHVGFLLSERTEVEDAYRRILPTGIRMTDPEERHGAYVFYMVVPGNILVEIGHRPDA